MVTTASRQISFMSMPRLHGIILAGGPGKRQRALSCPAFNPAAQPKAMLPAGNRVLIDFSIEALKQIGLNKIYVSAGPRPLSEVLERHITNRNIYKVDIHLYNEEQPLDTAGGVKYLIQNFLNINPEDTVCVLPCDTPHNIDLNPIFQSHLRNQAAVTVAVLPINWSSIEWKERTFGTIQLSSMPRIENCRDRNHFEEEVVSYAREHQGEAYQVKGFFEGQEREKARSNLINTSIYFFKAGFLMEIAPFITARKIDHPFSDLGLHVLSLIGGRAGEFADHNMDPAVIKKAKKGEYPFYAFLLPADTYWRDISDPLSLLRVNMDILRGRLDTQLSPRFWKRQNWGWQGHFSSVIHTGAAISPPEPGTIGSVIGSHVTIESGARISNSVILDWNTLAGETEGSVIFPGSDKSKGRIGRGVKLVDCIYTGGDLTYSEVPRTIDHKIIYKNRFGGISYDPL